MDPSDLELALKAEVASLNDALFQLQQRMIKASSDAAELVGFKKKQSRLDAKLRSAVKRLKQLKSPQRQRSPLPPGQLQRITFMFPDGKEVAHAFVQSSSLQKAVTYVGNQIQNDADDFDFVFNGEIVDLSMTISEVGFTAAGDQVQAVVKAEDQDAMQQLFMGMESASFFDEDMGSPEEVEPLQCAAPEEAHAEASTAPAPEEAHVEARIAPVGPEEHQKVEPVMPLARIDKFDAEAVRQESPAESEIRKGRERAEQPKADAKVNADKHNAEAEAAVEKAHTEAKKRLDDQPATSDEIVEETKPTLATNPVIDEAESTPTRGPVVDAPVGPERANVLKGILMRRLKRRGVGAK